MTLKWYNFYFKKTKSWLRVCVSVSCVNSSGSGREKRELGILNFPVDRAETRNKERKQNAAENMKRALEKQKNQWGKKE